MTATMLRVALLLLVPASAALAQKNCKKGIPCGNTCIAANKTCRVGTPAASKPAQAPPAAKAPATTAAPTVASGDWAASSIGTTYYRAGCSGAKKLSPKNLVFFKTEEDAQKAGYRRSSQKGC